MRSRRRGSGCSRDFSAAPRSPTARSTRLQWLGDVLGVRQSLCLVRAGRRADAVHGRARTACRPVPRPRIRRLARRLGPTRSSPRSAHRRHAYFPRRALGRRAPAPARRRRSRTRRSTSCRSASPASTTTRSGCCCSPAAPQLTAELQWFTTVFGQKLDQILRQQALADGDRKQGRERSLLYSIINAVTDPILLTDTEGRLLIANARALTLFTASEEESEGRRSAVRMNNMLLSSALSSKAIEETGAARRELLLVNPVDGSDLLFELLSTVTEDPRHGTGVVSILRNVSDLRRASEEIEENYRRLRIAEAQARAESDRLNLIIDSVADPIVVTDAAGATSLMNEPAERLFTMPARPARPSSAAVQANDAHFSSFIAGMLVSADQRRVGEIGARSIRAPAKPMPVEAIAGKILSEHGELTAVVTILHDRREALEKARLYEQLKAGVRRARARRSRRPRPTSRSRTSCCAARRSSSSRRRR